MVERRARLEDPKTTQSVVYHKALEVIQTLNEFYDLTQDTSSTKERHSQRTRSAISQIYRDLLDSTHPYMTNRDLINLANKFRLLTTSVHTHFGTHSNRGPQVLYRNKLPKQ